MTTTGSSDPSAGQAQFGADVLDDCPAADEPVAEWWRHEDGRWVVGEAGGQPDTVVMPSGIAPTRPDTILDGARLGEIAYRAVSLRGLSHRHSGKPRQDAYQLRVSANRLWLAGCVADGVSSGDYSHLAADLACREITRVLAEALGEHPAVQSADDWPLLAASLPWQQAVDRASAAIVARASSSGESGDDTPQAGPARRDAHQVRQVMATTAVAFVVAAASTADGEIPFAVTVASGDSSALLLSGGQWHPVTSVKNVGAEVASNAVLALPREVQVEPKGGVLRPGEALAVISDGVGDPLGSGTGVVGRFLAAAWSRPPELLSFAEHVAFYRKTFVDDRTAALVWHSPGSGAGILNGHPPAGADD
jgi:serine/threonine protein phosphatase PrpC